MKIDPRFITKAGTEIFTGSELLVKGALETEGGVHLLTGYPGSPIAAFFDTLQRLSPMLNENGIVAKIANNEALSMAMVNGAQMAGCRAITCFKSVGVHVASDALALGVLAGTQPGSGGLVVCGDDPWSDSTQVPADSRYIAEHVRLPMVEPSSPQEVKDWINLCFKLGEAGRIFIGYLMTTAQADGGGTVECRGNQYPQFNEHQRKTLSYERDIEPTLEQTVLLPPRTWHREQGMDERFAAVKRAAREHGINRVLNGPQKGEVVPMGFIVAGNAASYLSHAMSELGLTGRIPVLKLGLVYPVDEEIVTDFAQRCEQLVVIEERRGFVERQILEILQPLIQAGQLKTEIYGKQFPRDLQGIPETRGLNPSLLMERLIPLIKHHPTLPIELTNGRLSAELKGIQATREYDVNIPSRTPTFCPGCPHRDSSSVLLELRRDLLDPQYMLSEHKRKPVDMVAHGDTGCYTMLMFEPTKPLMHNYSGMGLGGGTGLGVDSFIENKQIVFLGDGTFYHSGMTAISQSIYNGQDITYIILDNKTTAMTGHQLNPGDAVDLRGNVAFGQDIERIVKSMIPNEIKKDVRIVRINPEDRDRYRRLLEQTILADGVKVVVADKECGIVHHRRARKQERITEDQFKYLPRKTFMNVATEVCENCRECTNQTGCPGLKTVDTDYGTKVQTDSSWCVNDAACQRIHACPSFEEVTVVRKQAPRKGDEYVDLTDLPDAAKPIHAGQGTWRCYLAGVGGMGVGLCTAILVTAGHEMGYRVQFLDKKGLAIRNGGVFSQIVYTRDEDTVGGNGNGNGHHTTPQIPYGKADVLLGIDILEACRALDPQHPYRVASDRTATVVNTAKTPTISTLMETDDFDTRDLEHILQQYTTSDRYFGFNIGDLCERMLDSKLYANIMMLGMAYQLGYLPVKLEAIEKAISTVVKYDIDRNLRAFRIGRKIVVRPDQFVVEEMHEYESAKRAFRRKVNTLRTIYHGKSGRRTIKQYRVLMKQTQRATRGLDVDDQLMRDVVVRAYDCLIWGGIDYAKRYCKRLVEIFGKDDPARGHKVTRAVVWNLAKVMLIKDEVYVSALLTSPEKYKRDRRRFSVNPNNGDRIVYKHHNRPEFDIFGRRIRFHWKARDWQLRLMSKARFLRDLLPSWHIREREFRDWYEKLVDQCEFTSDRDYLRWAEVLNTPESVTGYREVRYPKMESAKRKAEFLLSLDPEKFDPDAGKQDDSVVHLPIVTVGAR